MAKITVEVVSTPAELARGLMYRKHMDKDAGMLFDFTTPKETSFWGQNTYIPLDVAFIGEDKRIQEIRNIVPLSTRMIHSSDKCKYALEVNAGYFEDNKIKEGDFINIKDLENKSAHSKVQKEITFDAIAD